MKFIRKCNCIMAAVLCILVIYLTKKSFWWQKLEDDFLESHTCPACFGDNMCPEFYPSANSIHLEGLNNFKFYNLFSVRNVYFASDSVNKFVLKKLAHYNELQIIDSLLCEASSLNNGCNVSSAMNIILKESTFNNIEKHPQLFNNTDLLKCNHKRVISYFMDKFVSTFGSSNNMGHFLMALAVNPEPIILSVYMEKQFPFPNLLGFCGRIVVEEYVGATLYDLANNPWIRRVIYAYKLILLAFKLTDGKFRLYMTDVASHNFAVNKNDDVFLIDLENIIVVDPFVKGLKNEEHHALGSACKDCLSYNIEDLCSHTSADHNFFAICKGLLSSHAYDRSLPHGLLHSPPTDKVREYPKLWILIEECAFPKKFGSRRLAADNLREYLMEIIDSTEH